MTDDLTSRMTTLAAAFRARDERMRGLPIHNAALDVEIVETRPWQDFYVGILITPWCMNLVLLPQDPDGMEAAQAGTPREVDLPCGRSMFIAGDPELGEPFWACSLFSPVLEFPDQAAARAVAERVMAELLSPPKAPPAGARGDRRTVTRRDLLRGGPPG